MSKVKYTVVTDERDFIISASNRNEAAELFLDLQEFNDPETFLIKADHDGFRNKGKKYITAVEIKKRKKKEKRTESNLEVPELKQSAESIQEPKIGSINDPKVSEQSTVQTVPKQNLVSNNASEGEISTSENNITENANKITRLQNLVDELHNSVIDIITYINNKKDNNYDDIFGKMIDSNTKAMTKAAADWSVQVIGHIKEESKQNAINLNDSTNLARRSLDVEKDNIRLKVENKKHIEDLIEANKKYDSLKTEIDNKNNQNAEDVKQDKTQNTNLTAKIWPESLSTKYDKGHFNRLTKCFINGDITERDWQILVMVPYQLIDEEFRINTPALHNYTEHLFTILNHLTDKEVLPKESCEPIVKSFAEWLSETTKIYTLEAPTIGGAFKRTIHARREGSGKIITKVHSMVIYKTGENRPNQAAEVDV